MTRPAGVCYQRNMSTLWRAADVAPAERADSFREFLAGNVAPYGDLSHVILRDDDQVRSAGVGMLWVARGRWAHGEGTRTERLIREFDPELCKIDVPLAGHALYADDDRQAVAGAGTFTLVDLSRPHRIGSRDGDLAVVYFPRALLPLHDDDITRLAGTTFGPASPGGALVTSVVRELTEGLDGYEGPAGARIATSVLDLIAATLMARLERTAALEADTRRRVLLLRVRAFIEENLADPGLTPAVIAARHHISPRYLHRLFEAEQVTVAGLIRARRLARCRHDLRDPALAARPVSAIAARWGYRDAAYFSRVFRAEYGMPPGEYRRSYGTGIQESTEVQ